MGKSGMSRLALLASQRAGVQKLLKQLAPSNRRAGQTIQISWTLTKALLASSSFDSPFLSSATVRRSLTFAEGRNNHSINTDFTDTSTSTGTNTLSNHLRHSSSSTPTATATPAPTTATTRLTPQGNPGTLLERLVQPCLDHVGHVALALPPWVYTFVILARLPLLLLFLSFPLPPASLSLLSIAGPAMASYASSTSSSPSTDISTPRSRSPSSVASARSSHSSISSSKRMSISSSRRIFAANPMASVDIEAIEEAMRMAKLDTLRGYAQNNYAEVKQLCQTEYIPKHQALGYQILNEPMWNKGESTESKPRHSGTPAFSSPSQTASPLRIPNSSPAFLHSRRRGVHGVLGCWKLLHCVFPQLCPRTQSSQQLVSHFRCCCFQLPVCQSPSRRRPVLPLAVPIPIAYPSTSLLLAPTLHSPQPQIPP